MIGGFGARPDNDDKGALCSALDLRNIPIEVETNSNAVDRLRNTNAVSVQLVGASGRGKASDRERQKVLNDADGYIHAARLSEQHLPRV